MNKSVKLQEETIILLNKAKSKYYLLNPKIANAPMDIVIRCALQEYIK